MVVESNVGYTKQKDGTLINADVNGALNIMRKVCSVTRKTIERVKAFVVMPVYVMV